MARTEKYQDYTATINNSVEDAIYFGKVTGIGDLVTFEGDSISEPKTHLKKRLITTLNVLALKQFPNQI